MAWCKMHGKCDVKPWIFFSLSIKPCFFLPTASHIEGWTFTHPSWDYFFTFLYSTYSSSDLYRSKETLFWTFNELTLIKFDTIYDLSASLKCNSRNQFISSDLIGPFEFICGIPTIKYMSCIFQIMDSFRTFCLYQCKYLPFKTKLTHFSDHFMSLLKCFWAFQYSLSIILVMGYRLSDYSMTSESKMDALSNCFVYCGWIKN